MSPEGDQAIRARLAEAEAVIAALRSEEVDAVVGKEQVLLLRLREAEEALRRQEQEARAHAAEMEAIYNSAPVGLCVFDDRLRYVRINQRLAEINGRPAAEHIGRTPREIVPDLADLAEALLRRVVQTGTAALDVEFVGTTAAQPGVQRTWVSQWLPLKDETGRVIGVNVVAEEITRRKQAEAALKELNERLEQRVAERTALAEQRARDLRQLAGELSHAEHRERKRLAQVLHDHLQQLLVAARLRLPCLAPAGGSPGDAKSLPPEVRALDGLLGECISVSRDLTMELSPPVLQRGTLPEVFEWLARWFGEKHKLAVAVKAQAGLPPAPEHLRVFLFQAVRELLLNVAKHSGAMEARVDLSLRGGRLVIQVDDSGTRFDPRTMEAKLTRPQGFGLFNIRERLEALEGRLEIGSSPTGGASFRLIVPLSTVAQPAPRPGDGRRAGRHRASPQQQRSGKDRIRLLVVDDHKALRRGFVSFLQRQPDFEVVGEAADGKEAVRLAEALRPDAIVMDVSMPVLDGIGAARRIKRRHPDTLIVALSFHEDEAVARAVAEAGAEACLYKAGPYEDLVKTIRRAWLGRQRPGQASG